MRTLDKILLALSLVGCPALAMFLIVCNQDEKGWWWKHDVLCLWVAVWLVIYSMAQFAALAFVLTYPW